MYYQVFNAILESNLLIDELAQVRAQAPDCVFQLHPAQPQNGTPQWFHHWVCEDNETPWLYFAQTDDIYLLRFPDLADFTVTPDGSRVTCHPAPDTPPETIRHLLLDQIMPLVLAQQGRCIIHASGVIGPHGQALAFAAASGSGKSTLAAHLTRQGWQLLSDDGLLVAEEAGQILILPGYPGLRLLEDSRDTLFGAEAPVANYAHYTGKKRLALHANGVLHTHRAVPLQHLYFLAPPGPANEIEITPLTPREAFLQLVSYTFQLDMRDTGQLKNNFARFSRLTAAPIFFQLAFPRNWERLPEVSAALLRHIAGKIAKG